MPFIPPFGSPPGGGGGATTELDNLGTTAINTSLISDTDSTDDLGSSSVFWANIFVDKINLGDAGAVDWTLDYTDINTASTLNITPGNALIQGALHIDAGNQSGANSVKPGGLGVYVDGAANLTYFGVYDTSNTSSPKEYFRVTREASSDGASYTYCGERSNNSRLYLGSTSEYIKGGGVTVWEITRGWAPSIDSTLDLGSSSLFWNQTFTDELILTNVGAAAAAADKLVLSAVDLSAGNTILAMNTEGTGVVGTGTPTADRTIAIEVNGTTFYIIASTSAS